MQRVGECYPERFTNLVELVSLPINLVSKTLSKASPTPILGEFQGERLFAEGVWPIHD